MKTCIVENFSEFLLNLNKLKEEENLWCMHQKITRLKKDCIKESIKYNLSCLKRI